MDDLEGFAEWRPGIESRVSTLEASVEVEKLARAGMDVDVGDLKVAYGTQKGMLQAFSRVQSNHTATLGDHTATLTRLEDGLTKVEAGIRTIIGLLDRDIDGADGSP